MEEGGEGEHRKGGDVADDLGQEVIFLADVVRQILRLCVKKEIETLRLLYVKRN